MGNISLACVSCIERDQDEKAVQSSDLQEFENSNKSDQAKTSIVQDDAPMAPSPSDILKQSTAPKSIDDKLQARINTIINARCKPSPDRQLQDQMNAILNARKQSQAASCSGVEQQGPIDAKYSQEVATALASPAMMPYYEDSWAQSPMAQSPWQQSQMAWSHDDGLQDQINAIVGVHAKSLNHQRLSLDLASPSPSPAKSVSDMELGYFANLALSRAKERSTPLTAPPTMQPSFWSQDAAIYEQHVAPCKLSFADCGNAFEAQADVASTILAESDSAAPKAKAEQKCADITIGGFDIKKELDQPAPFDVSKIPSPTRSRAKKMAQSLWADIEVEAAPVGAPQQKVVEEETEATDEEAAAQRKKMQAKWLLEFEEKQEMAAMDKLCVETFLESVKKVAWRKRVATPIKGSNLYTKHIRPSRPSGTSVDVKDSTFRNLGSFLQFLESEYLLRLQPGASDPVVTEINFDACRKYKYDAQQQQRFLAAIQAPHGEGCSCRLCVPCATKGWC
jgi:hypothetical protein